MVPRRIQRRQIRMALQTHLLHLRPVEHARIRRTVRRVAGRTSLESHRTMLEGERPAFVAMAIEASRLVRAERLRHRGLHAAVRIVAIDAAHRALRQLVMKRLLELRRDRQMAAFALLVDRFRFAHHQLFRRRRVNLVAGGAGHLILGVAALQAADVRRLVQVTGEANSIDSSGGELSWIPNIGGVRRSGVFRSRTVARFAGLPVPAPLFVGAVDHMVRSSWRTLWRYLHDKLRRLPIPHRARRAGAAGAEHLALAPPPPSNAKSKTRLILRMHLIDGIGCAGAMANRAGFAERGCVRQEVRCAGRSTWQPEQADEIGWTGLIGPCGSITGFSPVGSGLLARSN